MPLNKETKPKLTIFKQMYHNIFLRKKSNRPCVGLDLATVKKGDKTVPKSYYLFLSRTTIQTLSMNSENRIVKAQKT